MILYAVIFYVVSALILASTAMAVTRKNPVHAVVYLVISFLGSALLFYILGAPFLAALEVIIYAGAIMVLFLFVVMMLKMEAVERRGFSLSRTGCQPWSSACCSSWSLRLRSSGIPAVMRSFRSPSLCRQHSAVSFSSTTGLRLRSSRSCSSSGWWPRSSWAGAKGKAKVMETAPETSGKEV